MRAARSTPTSQKPMWTVADIAEIRCMCEDTVRRNVVTRPDFPRPVDDMRPRVWWRVEVLEFFRVQGGRVAA